jgi:hypothetical protein
MKQVGQENISSSVTEDTYKTIKSLLKSLLENTTEDDGTRITEGDSYKTNVYDATLTYDVAEWVTSQGVNSTLLSMIKEYVSGTKEETAEDGTVTYTTTNKIPVSVPVKATSKNMEQTLQAWIVDMNASGMNKVHFVIAGIDDESGVSNLQAALKTAGEGAIVTILSNVTEDITISESMTLNLNGKTITGSLTADGCTVTIVDSTLDTTGAGAITEGQGVEKALIATNDGAFKVTAGKYGEGVIDDSWLPEGYSQNSDGYVTNSLYSITVDEYGNITLNVLATFLDTSTVPDVTTMVQDLAYDLILNFYTAAAFQVTTSDGTYSIYTIDFDNALSLVNEVSSEGKSGLLNKVIGKISVDGVNALANELIKTLTDFKTLGTASGSSYVIGTYKLEQAAWDVNLSLKEDTSKKAESENEGSENEGSEKAKSENEGSKNTESENSKNYYVDLQIAPKTKTTQTTNTETGETTETKTYDWSSRTFKVQVVDPDANGTNMAELATLSNSLNDIVTIDDATKLSVTKITYENGDLQVTGDTDGRLATAKVTVNLAKDANYPQILAVVIADNAENISKDSKDALVAGIEGYQKSGDISALKKAIEGVTSAELFSALKNAKGKSFSQMLSDLGLTNADAEALEKTYDKMLNVLYVLINKLGLEGSGATLGSKKMQNKPGTYQVSGMKKRICAELTIQLFANGSVSAADTDGSVIYEGNNLAAAIAAANKVNGIVTVTSATTLTEDVTVTGKVSIIGAKLISYVGENTTYHHILLGNVNATVTADGSLSYTVKGESRSGVILPNTTDWQYYKVTETNKNGTYIYTMEVEDPTVRSTLTSSKVEVTVTNSKGEKTVIIKGASVDDANKRISLDLEPEKGITVEQFKTYIFKQVLAVNAEGYEVKLVNSNNKQLADGDSVGTGAKVVITATNKGDKNVTNDDKTVVATYTIIVMGDLNGNGRNDSGDASMLMQNYMNRIQLTDVQKIAGDINNTVGIDSGDAVRIMTKYMTWNKGTYQTNLK